MKHPMLYKLARFTFRVFRPLLRVLKKKYDMYKKLLPDMHYHAWASHNEEGCFVEKAIVRQPLISVVVPLYNTQADHLLHTIYSVINQHYENWELVLVNGSDKAECRKQAEDCQNIDTRIKLVDLKKNEGISGNTNAGIAQATGEFIAFLDHDDVLHPCALHCVAEALQSGSPPDLIYTDEDKITDTGDRYFEPHCKPNWSPDLLRNVNYINHLTVMRTEHVRKVGGLRSAYNGAQDYDLLLRVIDTCQPKIHHVPRVLYHWRAAATSTAQDISNKTYIFKAGTRAIQEHLERNHINAAVAPLAGKPGFYKLTYHDTSYSIIVGPVAVEKRYACAQWVRDLTKKADKKAEIIIGSWYKKYERDYPAHIPVRYVEESASYWKAAAKRATKEVVVCFKMAVLPENAKALSELAAVAADEHHYAATPVIIDEYNSILDAGIVDTGALPKQLFLGSTFGQNTYFGSTEWVRNVSDAMTHVLAMKTSLFRPLAEKHFYDNTPTLRAAAQGKFTSDNLVLWTHIPFTYKGVLTTTCADYNIQLSRLTPETAMCSDNWGNGYERSEK